MTTYRLSPIRWPRERLPRLDGTQWYWTDLTGANLRAELPASPPENTLAWGWSSGRWYRVRFVGPELIGAELTETDEAGDHEPLQVAVENTTTWPKDERRVALTVSPGTPDLRDRALVLRRVVGRRPLTFLEVCG